jgi:hypothetical protein
MMGAADAMPMTLLVMTDYRSDRKARQAQSCRSQAAVKSRDLCCWPGTIAVCILYCSLTSDLDMIGSCPASLIQIIRACGKIMCIAQIRDQMFASIQLVTAGTSCSVIDDLLCL